MATSADEAEGSTEATHRPLSIGRFQITAPRVFLPAAGLIIVFVTLTLILPERMGSWLGTVNGTVVGDLGWYYVIVVSGFVFFAAWLAFSPVGNVVLGKDDDEPEFGLGSWFAMLFAAGMGIGLVFWGVAEPLNHFDSPPPGTGTSDSARADTAFDVTFLHWGLHAWAIYVVVGLSVAYVVHRKGRPISIRWALEPLLGADRVRGRLGDAIDVIAVVGTLFGVATSLGFGVTQVGAGLAYLDVIDVDADTGQPAKWILLVLILAITALATVSVATGVEKGIRILSNVNMVLAGVLLLAVLALGPTVFLLSDFVQSLGSYIQAFFRLSFQTLAFQGEDGKAWLSGWTTFYWGWWISWAPFVGVFIARISRGRTVREFVAGVLLVPTLVTFLWFAVLGGNALHTEIFGAGGLIDPEEGVSTNAALFQMLDGLPLGTVLSVLAIFLIVVFFVTSSDSGSYVVDMLASGGDPNPPVWSRVMWAVLEGLVAAALLLASGTTGLGALQTMAILLAAPFSIVMILMMFSMARALLHEHRMRERTERRLLAAEVAGEIVRRSELGLLPDGTAPPDDPDGPDGRTGVTRGPTYEDRPPPP